MLHALMCGIGVVAHPRAHSWNLVGGDARAYAAPANEQTALRFLVDHSAAHRFGEIRIVGGIFVERADVQHLMPERAQQIPHGDFQLETGVIRANHNFHACFPRTSLAVAITRSAKKPNFFSTSFKGAEAPKLCMPIILPLGPT